MRYTPTSILSTYAAVSALNANFNDIATLLEKCLFTDGTSPNSMLANLDLNHYRINNLAPGVDDTDAVSKTQVETLIQALTGITNALQSTSVTYKSTGTGAVNRTSQAKLADWTSFKDFGVVANGIVDDTVAAQAAIVYAASTGYSLLMPSNGIIRTTAPLTSSLPISIWGLGTVPFTSGPTGIKPTTGSWFYFDHTGIGLNIDGTSNSSITGVNLHDFGTFRNQPVPTGGWTPTANDYDIVLNSVDATLENLMLLNPTKGIKADNGGYSRLTMRNIAGQFMQVGIYIDHQYDVVFLDTFRNWSFWKDDANVEAYTTANCDSIYLQRVDNPQFSNIFSIRHRSAIRIGTSGSAGTGRPGGSVSKLKIANLDADLGKFGLWFDPTAIGSQVDVVNFSAQGDSISGSCGVFFDDGSSNNLVSLVNADIRNMNENAIRNAGTGTGNQINLGGRLYINGFNQAISTFPALEASTGNTIVISAFPTYANGNSGANTGGAGTFKTATYT